MTPVDWKAEPICPECGNEEGFGDWTPFCSEKCYAVAEHWYLSTACLHKEHEACREECKFCPARCECACHYKEPLQQEIDKRSL